MYIYPDNLKAKATMWLWSLKDLAIVGTIILFSVFAFAYAGVWFPLVIAGAYAGTDGNSKGVSADHQAS